MVTTDEAQQHVEQIDAQILKLLADRAKYYANIQTEDGGVVIDESEVVGFWIEEADENGLNPAVIERIAKLTNIACKKTEE